MIAAGRRAVQVAASLIAACASPVPPPAVVVPPPAEPATGMAREQLLFASGGADPTLLAIVFQRVRDGAGASIEAKAFLVWDGVWRPPFWERVAVPRWPGIGLDPALAAWEDARGGKALRVAWTDGDQGLHVALRAPEFGVAIDAPALTDAGTGADPHGAVAWRTGPAEVTVNGAVRTGLVVVEALAGGAKATPSFGKFEMWLATPGPGELVLGRRTLSADSPGEAVRVTAAGAAIDAGFPVAVAGTRPDAKTGFGLPSGWQLGDHGPSYARIDGEIGRGRGPDGQPAAYDVAFARQVDGSNT